MVITHTKPFTSFLKECLMRYSDKKADHIIFSPEQSNSLSVSPGCHPLIVEWNAH